MASNPGTHCIKDSAVVNVGTLRHVMEENRVQTVAALNTLVKKEADSEIDMNGNVIRGLPDLSGDFTMGELSDPESTYAVRKRWIRQYFATLSDNAQKVNKAGDTMTGALTLSGPPMLDLHAASKAYVDESVAEIPTPDLSGYVKKDGTVPMTGALTLSGAPTSDLHAATKKYVDDGLAPKANSADVYTKQTTDTLLNGKKSTETFDTKIQNANAQSAVSCDTDRYISLKSMNNKLCDILEDEVNAGCTINTYAKRFNVVSQQPQTFYHNSPAALFNMKYSDDGNTTPGQARYGQLQIAPSNTTNLNPAVTLISSRINGLGTVGSLFLDSAYGNANVPLIVAPQSLTDANANTMVMYRNTATLPAGTPRTTFSRSAGYASGVVPTNGQDFATKSYVDDAVSGAAPPDLSGYVKADGTVPMTGALVLSGSPTADDHAARKKYVDDQISARIPEGGFVGDLLSEASANPVSLYLDQSKFRFRTSLRDILNVFSGPTASYLSTPIVMRRIDEPLLIFDAVVSSTLPAPDVLMTGFFAVDENQAFRLDYPQLQITNEKNADMRLSSYVRGTNPILYTRLYLHPGARTRTNYIEADRLLGYKEDATLPTPNDFSILPRSLNDARYALKSEVTTPYQIVANSIAATVDSTVASQPEFRLDYTASPMDEAFFKVARVTDTRATATTHREMVFQTNSLSPEYKFSIKSALHQLDLVANQVDNTSKIVSAQSEIRFDDSKTNNIQFSKRVGLATEAVGTTTDNNSFLTKSEITTLIQSSGGGGAGGSFISSADGSVVSANDSAVMIVRDAANTQSMQFQALAGSIFQTGGSVLNLRAKNDVSVDGGSMVLYTTTQADGLSTKFLRATGYTFDGVDVTSSKQFTHKAYVDAQRDTRYANTTTLNNIALANGNVSLNNNRLTDLANPTSNQDAATRAWVLAQIAASGLSQYPSSYTVVIGVGDVPSTVDSWSSTGDKDSANIVTGVTYNNQSSTQGYYTVSLRTTPTGPFGTGNYEVMVSIRSLRTGTPSTIDNDISIPIIVNKSASSFQVMLEETGTVSQNIAVVCLLVPSP